MEAKDQAVRCSQGMQSLLNWATQRQSTSSKQTAYARDRITKLTDPSRAELGRAAWKVLHTTFGRFPEKPTDEEKEALRSYVHLFQRLYPWYATLSYSYGVVVAEAEVHKAN